MVQIWIRIYLTNPKIYVNKKIIPRTSSRDGARAIAFESNCQRAYFHPMLVLVLSDWNASEPNIYVTHQRNRHLSARIRAFVD